MTAGEIRRWSNHPCANQASQNPEEVRQRVIRLLETDAEDWGASEYEAAGRVISFVSRMRGNESGDPVSGEDCNLSARDISLINWGYMPPEVDITLPRE